jgi:hypothetical protein
LQRSARGAATPSRTIPRSALDRQAQPAALHGVVPLHLARHRHARAAGEDHRVGDLADQNDRRTRPMRARSSACAAAGEFVFLFELLHASPHAAELLSAEVEITKALARA